MSAIKVALVTGGAKRVGRVISLKLHENGYRVIVHCCTSVAEAKEITDQMNSVRADSAAYLQADLSRDVSPTCKCLVECAVAKWGRLDVIINNAANFVAESLLEISSERYDMAMNVNLKAPVFIMQAAAEHLKKVKGCIVNIGDMIGEFPTKSHFSHSVSKAGLVAGTKSAAQNLAPEIRVNAVSPGCVLWPEVDPGLFSEAKLQKYEEDTPLNRVGTPDDVAKAVLFLIASDCSGFITGHILHLDGGRSLTHMSL